MIENPPLQEFPTTSMHNNCGKGRSYQSIAVARSGTACRDNPREGRPPCHFVRGYGRHKGVAKIVLESVQEMLLKLALQIARDYFEDRRERQRQGIKLARTNGKYRGRPADSMMRERIVTLRVGGKSISAAARLAGCSVSQVKRVWAEHKG